RRCERRARIAVVAVGRDEILRRVSEHREKAGTQEEQKRRLWTSRKHWQYSVVKTTDGRQPAHHQHASGRERVRAPVRAQRPKRRRFDLPVNPAAFVIHPQTYARGFASSPFDEFASTGESKRSTHLENRLSVGVSPQTKASRTLHSSSTAAKAGKIRGTANTSGVTLSTSGPFVTKSCGSCKIRTTQSGEQRAATSTFDRCATKRMAVERCRAA